MAPPQGPENCLPDPAAIVLNSRGAVHFQDCEIIGARGFGSRSLPVDFSLGAGGHALCIEQAFNVVVQDCVLRGGGGDGGGFTFRPGGTGGSALRLIRNSQVTLSSSTVTGGDGGNRSNAGEGGVGALLGESSRLLAYSSSISGGSAGASFVGSPRDGGDGLVSTATGSEVVLQMTSLMGGFADSFSGGDPGKPLSGPLNPVLLDGNPCTLDAPTLVVDGQSFQIQADEVGVGGGKERSSPPLAQVTGSRRALSARCLSARPHRGR